MSFKIQESIVRVLTTKTIKAALKYNVKSIILGGGVSANTKLKEEFKRKIKENNLHLNFFASSRKLSTDNAAMVAFAGYIFWNKRTSLLHEIKSQPALSI